MSQLAHRYAKAAWEAALPVQAGQPLIDALAAFDAALTASPRLMQALVNPAFKNERGKVLRQLLGAHDISPIATKLLQLLLEHERLALVAEIVVAVQALADAAAGRMRAQVKLAVAAPEHQLARIAAVLQERVGKPVVLDVEVDASLVTGMICRIGKLTFDSSLKKQLAQFAERAGAAGAPI